MSLEWRHDEHDCVSNHRRLECLLYRLFRRRSKKTSKLRITGLCAGNSPVTGEFPAQRASNAENVSIWWRHHGEIILMWMPWTSLIISCFTGSIRGKLPVTIFFGNKTENSRSSDLGQFILLVVVTEVLKQYKQYDNPLSIDIATQGFIN